MTFTPEFFDDLQKAALPDLRKGEIGALLSTAYQEYFALEYIYRRDNVKMASGKSCTFRVKARSGQTANRTGMSFKVNYGIRGLMEEGSVPWRFLHSYLPWNERELLMAADDEEIFDIFKMRQIDEVESIAEKLEGPFWGAPAPADVLNVYGMNYWFPFDSSLTTRGFTFSTFLHPDHPAGAGGILPTNVPGWRHGHIVFKDIARSDLIRSMKIAHVRTKWKSPTSLEGTNRANMRRRLVIATGIENWTEFTERGEDQNDRLGPDVASLGEDIMFWGHVIRHVPYLDVTDSLGNVANPTKPLYMLDLDTFEPRALKGDFMRRQKPKQIPFQPMDWARDMTLTDQLVVLNKRTTTVAGWNAAAA